MPVPTEAFERIKSVLERYSPPFVARSGGVRGKADYQLYSEKDVVIEGRPRSEVFFAGLIEQKGYTGFYYMPVYADAEAKRFFEPELLRLLKGKSCFHVKRVDDRLVGQIEQALERGLELYRGRGWV